MSEITPSAVKIVLETNCQGFSNELLYDAFQRYPRKKWQSRKSLVLLKLHFHQQRDIKNVSAEISAKDNHFQKQLRKANWKS